MSAETPRCQAQHRAAAVSAVLQCLLTEGTEPWAATPCVPHGSWSTGSGRGELQGEDGGREGAVLPIPQKSQSPLIPTPGSRDHKHWVSLGLWLWIHPATLGSHFQACLHSRQGWKLPETVAPGAGAFRRLNVTAAAVEGAGLGRGQGGRGSRGPWLGPWGQDREDAGGGGQCQRGRGTGRIWHGAVS